LAERVARSIERGIAPRLAVAIATDDPAARAYLRAKQKVGERLGIDVLVRSLPDPSTESLLELIAEWSCDEEISGIVLEAPLPASIDTAAIRRTLPAGKDVDGAGVASLGRLISGQPGFVPATAAAALMLAETDVSMAGRRVAILGRSLVVGRPLAVLAMARDATVTVCHSKTRDLVRTVREAEVLFVAVGHPGFVTAEMVRPGAVVIDIGINEADGRVVGDVDAESVEDVAGALSPVPGGVGPLTTTLLFEHVVQAAEQRSG
jgi:methylenetetrahydrofolate dehydrogenase (NADP+)/methenyltetrahydrofolate cyclohydrolase